MEIQESKNSKKLKAVFSLDIEEILDKIYDEVKENLPEEIAEKTEEMIIFHCKTEEFQHRVAQILCYKLILDETFMSRVIEQVLTNLNDKTLKAAVIKRLIGN